MSKVDEHGRTEPPIAADERATLLGFLDYQRATFAWKCAGVDAAGLRTTIGDSSMSLGGMLKHLALVEDWWFSCWLFGNEPAPPWAGIDWDTDPDWEWRTAADDSPDQLRSLWEESVDRSRALTGTALSRGDLGQLAQKEDDDGAAPSLRWIVLHMIEEYARHNGHADLIRESIDGSTGE
jgi:uncharacterized damage-inducible protein DinB